MGGPVAGGPRRDARERALHLLYEADRRGVDPAELLAGLEVAPDPYTAVLVTEVTTHRPQLRDRLARLSHGWALERMPVLDLLVLEMGSYELEHRPEIPTAVVLNEAVELATRYSTDDSGRFVNGVLAAAAAELRPTAT